MVNSVTFSTASRLVSNTESSPPVQEVGSSRGVEENVSARGEASKKLGAVHNEKEDNTAQSERLTKAVADLNEYVQNVRRNLEFNVDEESGRTVIKVIDSESRELVRQIPVEEILEISRRLNDMTDKHGGILLVDRV